MSAADPSRRLSALVKRLRSEYGESRVEAAPSEGPAGLDPLVSQLLYSFLIWEASASKASAGLKRLAAAVVDCNELRVCLPDELAGILGDRYPRAHERASRLKSTLNDIYRRQHKVSLEHLPTVAKREAWQYLCSLEGMPTFVAARLVLISLGGHAFPVDTRLMAALEEEGVAIPQDGPEGASGWLERQFRAGEALEPYLLLETWMNERTPKAAKASSPRSSGQASGASRNPGRRPGKG